VWRIV